MSTQPFTATSKNYQMALTTAATTAIQVGDAGTPCDSLWIFNGGLNTAFVQVGNSAADVAAPVAGMVGTPGTYKTYPVGSGMLVVVGCGNAPWVNALTLTSTSTLYLMSGIGQ